jgi:hypothetical protein
MCTRALRSWLTLRDSDEYFSRHRRRNDIVLHRERERSRRRQAQAQSHASISSGQHFNPDPEES